MVSSKPCPKALPLLKARAALLVQSAPPASSLSSCLASFGRLFASSSANSTAIMDLPPAPTPPIASAGVQSSSSESTANLLNLLKFSASGASESSSQSKSRQQLPNQHSLPTLSQPTIGHGQHSSARIHQPAPTAADPKGLLATLMRGNQELGELRQTQTPPSSAAQSSFSSFVFGSPAADTSRYLLNLLNRPKPSQTDQPLLTETSRSNGHTPQSVEATDDASRRTYHNPRPANSPQPARPFQQRHPSDLSSASQKAASNVSSIPVLQSGDSPADVSFVCQQLLSEAGKPSSQQTTSTDAPAAAPVFHILKKEQQALTPVPQHYIPRASSVQSPTTSPLEGTPNKIHRASSSHSRGSFPQSAKQTPTTSEIDSLGSADRNKESVAQAINHLAHQADQGARDALERVEYASQAAAVLNEAGQALNQKDGRQKPNKPNKQIKVAMVSLSEMETAQDPHEETTTEKLKHDAADLPSNHQGHGRPQAVADSWESIDQEEITPGEETDTPPVRVFNFPMKPWISITLHEDATETRPQFREESVMDIARLKKDFDQIDRNLYTASQHYMTYGMSKQGGLRVIRQEDGKDAKVFTDTRDRIFNVSMSVTPSDFEGAAHKEAIIGTGISGTVYWVQIKDGEKDHIEDSHLEQYGFALPPMVSHDLETPGGVLKTRARSSTHHPEYFAVGRGKYINFVWPSYVMHNELFKTGHDRVVDSDALISQCSLRINTGKAGKDFAFSQDDTVIVSLDKSGRVKFWDVRELTAAKENSDSRTPLPALTSLEIQEPLMTLACIPEGEKAYPTSVLLLDKQRPYQKRCALRYMIVGMKQNHTLQLWDLALRKPVQELNLPHSNESDAFCSLAYHPSSGMIVIGHPTRNSIYFAHLSAPKYRHKSVSQAEYIRRLESQDPSISQPNSTAVISGVREYSFASRGLLRSLDILSSPAMVQTADEPTLFELYAMHSKGVACLLIKQRELGWSKENEVLDGIDAVEKGLVTVSKLKYPHTPDSTRSETALVRTEHQPRGSNSQPLGHTSLTSGDATSRRLDTTASVKREARVVDFSPSAVESQAEKPDRKPRKKKGSSGKEADPVAANGLPSSVRATTSTPSVPRAAPGGSANANSFSDVLEHAIGGAETRLITAVSDTLMSSLRNLQEKIDEGARLRDESFNQHQLKLLDMVSEVLNENTQKVLESLIHHQFTELVIPAIEEHAHKVATEVIHHKLQPTICLAVQKEIQGTVPQAVGRALRSSDFGSALGDRVSSVVTNNLKQEILVTLPQRLAPTLTNLAEQSTQHVAGELHQQLGDHLEKMKLQHAAETSKMDQLWAVVSRLTDMVSTMAASQSSLQSELLNLKQQAVHELPGVDSATSGPAPNMGRSARGYGNNTVPQSTPASRHGSLMLNSAAGQARPNLTSPQNLRDLQSMASPKTSITSEAGGPSNMKAATGNYANQVENIEGDWNPDMIPHIQKVEKAIEEGRLQDAIIQWIQSGFEKEIFRRCLGQYPPNRFDSLPPLLLLVVIATISKDLTANLMLKQEIDWIEMAVGAFRDSLPNYVSNWVGIAEASCIWMSPLFTFSRLPFSPPSGQ